MAKHFDEHNTLKHGIATGIAINTATGITTHTGKAAGKHCYVPTGIGTILLD